VFVLYKGFGEISKYGVDRVKEIFNRFTKHEVTSGMGLWEINEMLESLKFPTIYDNAEYQRLLKNHAFLADREVSGLV